MPRTILRVLATGLGPPPGSKYTPLRRDDLVCYDFERANTGLRTHSRFPAAIVYRAWKVHRQ